MKNQLRKAQPDFSEKRFGYGGFLQFNKAAAQRGIVELEYDPEADDYVVRPGPNAPADDRSAASVTQIGATP